MRPLLLITTASYWCTMFIMTHLPPERMPHVRMSDKLQHLFAFMILGGLLYLCVDQRIKRALLVVAIIGASYAAIDELTQPLIGRNCELLDWLCDAGGVILGSLGVALTLRVARSSRTV